MKCRHCGTEIADKAIVCFRCGMGTSDPVRQPARLTPKRSPLLALVVMVLLVVLALFLGQASRTAANPDAFRLAAGICLGAALVVLLLRILRRR